MKRVVLLTAPSDVSDNPVPPLGLLAIASYVDSHLDGFRCEVVDLSRMELEEARRQLHELDWDDVVLVGLTVMSMDVLAAVEIAACARALASTALVIAGGPHASLAWREFLPRHSPPFDACVVGEGEAAVVAILERLANGSSIAEVPGVACMTPDGPELHSPARLVPPSEWGNPFTARVGVGADEVMYFTESGGRRRRGVSLVTSRSCPLACTFCSIAAMDEPYRSASPADVVEWLRWERARRPFEHIYFLDADFLTSKSRARAFSSAVSDVFEDVTWSVQATVGHVLSLRADLPELRGRGLRAVELGIEAGDDDELVFFNKRNFGKYATVRQSIDAVRLLTDAGIAVGIDYIMFYPDQTLAGLARNLSFFLRSGLLDAFDVNHYGHDLILFPGTPLRSLYEERCGHHFDTDVLPDTDPLYVDPVVRRIKREFRTGYLERYSGGTQTLRDELRAVARSTTSDRQRAVLRLHELRLRHHPYVVLERLILAQGDPCDVYAPVDDDLSAARYTLTALQAQDAGSA